MPLTRRTLLQASVAATAGLAGIAGLADQGDAARQAGIDDDPTVVKPRNPNGDVVLYEREEDGRHRARRQLVSDRARIDDLEFAEGVPAEDAEAALSFLEATDFEEETIYLATMRIEPCERYRIQSVSWTPAEQRVEFSYCTELRPPDVHCRVTGRDAVALIFRLPAVLSYEITRSGSSGHSPCDGTDTDYSVIEWNGTSGDR